MKKKPAITLFLLLLLVGCVTIPEGATAVQSFDAKKYLGKWYEIARFDFRFERNLNNVTANYSQNPDGSIKVVNRGYNYVEKKWEEVEGKAKFVESPDIARLKVSFFGPFYSAYNVIALDEQYRYALVAGKDLDYLWFLSRETTMPDEVKKDYLNRAAAVGYDTTRLIWVEHSVPEFSENGN